MSVVKWRGAPPGREAPVGDGGVGNDADHGIARIGHQRGAGGGAGHRAGAAVERRHEVDTRGRSRAPPARAPEGT